MNTCPNCNAPVEPDHRFCMECGYKIEAVSELPQEPQPLPQEPQPVVEEMVSVENHIMWNMQPGQVARLINEKEFTQYSDASGLIVNEGARVLIRRKNLRCFRAEYISSLRNRNQSLRQEAS